ncbi:MAG: hypothetical protein ACETVM_01930 [Candidatus Bathyarchaeia archaeon]
MGKMVGVFKKLDVDESVVFQTKTTTPTIFAKGTQVRKWRGFETMEVPIAYSMAKLYLTNKRLLFLIHSEIEAHALEQGKSLGLSDVAGTWFEIPILTIDDVNIVHKDIRKDETIKRFISSLSKRDTVELVRLIYDKRKTTGKMKELIDSTFKRIHLKKVAVANDEIYVMGKEIYKDLVKQIKLTAEKEKVEKLKKRLKKAKKKEKEMRTGI